MAIPKETQGVNGRITVYGPYPAQFVSGPRTVWEFTLPSYQDGLERAAAFDDGSEVPNLTEALTYIRVFENIDGTGKTRLQVTWNIESIS